jgi:hypothetical protein
MKSGVLRARQRPLVSRLVVFAVAALLTACVTAQNALSPAEIQSFRVADVRVSVPAGVPVQWADAQQEYLTARKISDDDMKQAIQGEEYKNWLRERVSKGVSDSMQRNLGGAFVGNRPVRVEVTVKRFEISHPLQRVLIGGGYAMAGDVTLADAKTGAVLSTYPDVVYGVYAGQGVGGALVQAAYDASNPPAPRIMNGFAEKYRDWLLNK